MIEKEDSIILNQLAVSLEETMNKMEKAYREKKADEFNNLRRFFLQIQDKIEEYIK